MKYQKILGLEISEKTSLEIERIIDYIEHPVIFRELPENNPHGFGRANYFSEPDRIVYSVTSLPQHAFEANLLHELYHLCQHHDGFPTTCTKIQPSLSQNDQRFLDGIGEMSASLILDLDVCDRIQEFGLNSSYFFDVRYQQAMSWNFDRITDRDSRISLTLCITGIILQNSRMQAQNVIRHHQRQNPNITRKAEKLAAKIKRCNHSTPIGCVECLTTMYDYLDIWGWQLINFQGTIISDSQTANSLLESFRYKGL